MFKKTTLDNGLRIVTKKLDNTQSVTVLILVGAGSRYETKDINGISHFLEHMFFKGGEKYKNTKEVSGAIDGVGGDFNAFTGKEYVGYYIKLAAQHLDLALDLLADMLLKSKFDEKEIDKERGVIMEEYNMYQDTPMYQVGWDFERLLYGDQPMGWDQVGTKEFIQKVTRDQFVAYKDSLYSPDNIVISAVGHVMHSHVVEMIEKLFAMKAETKQQRFAPLKKHNPEVPVYVHNKKTEQSHIVVGFPAYPEDHEDHYALKVLSVILGGNMSSRMFLSVREEQGLAYYIQTSTDDYLDSGVISTRAGVDNTRTKQAVTSVVQEYAKIKGETVPEDELKKAKDYLKGKLVLRLEDSEEYAHLIGKQELLHEKLKSPADISKEIDKVKAADIKRITEDLFHEDKMYLALIGPYEKSDEFARLLKF